jgi:ATP-dependent exoDNAse (exonuclease V) alpha subunit
MTNLTLNSLQSEFYNKVVAMDFSKLLLTGNAGTGKSMSLVMAMSTLHRMGKNVVMVAPTHLARLNLIDKLPQDVRRDMETMTVAALLSRFGFDRGDGTTQFTAPDGKRLREFDVIAIDEVSMLGQKDYDVLKASDTKIIFSGDFAQLPAVMAKSAKGDMTEGEERPEHFHFTEQMRQVGVIHQTAERNREEVHFPNVSVIGDQGEKIVVHDDRDSLIKEMSSILISECQAISDTTRYRYICHTNDGVSEVNDLIRSSVISHFLQASSEKHFVVGESLMLYENTRIAYNGEIVKVVDVWLDRRYSYVNPYPWESYKVIIESQAGIQKEIKALPPRHRPLYKQYFTQLQSDLHHARIQAKFSEADEILEEIKHLKSYWTNVNYPYAVTCHKSQGMTIPHVFLDTLSFSKAPNKKSLLYVGISRAALSLHTIRVEKSEAEVAKEVNARYREARHLYEEMTGGSYLDLKRKVGLSTRTPADKAVFTEYIIAVIADLEQDLAS